MMYLDPCTNFTPQARARVMLAVRLAAQLRAVRRSASS